MARNVSQPSTEMLKNSFRNERPKACPKEIRLPSRSVTFKPMARLPRLAWCSELSVSAPYRHMTAKEMAMLAIGSHTNNRKMTPPMTWIVQLAATVSKAPPWPGGSAVRARHLPWIRTCDYQRVSIDSPAPRATGAVHGPQLPHLSSLSRSADVGRRVDSAVRIPCRIRVGLGGHPGTATSTGITFETRPKLA